MQSYQSAAVDDDRHTYRQRRSIGLRDKPVLEVLA